MPSDSEMEATAVLLKIQIAEVSGTVWVTESLSATGTPVIVANALVAPQQRNGSLTIPIRLINPSAETVTLRKGVKIVQLDRVDPSAVVAGVDHPVELHDIPTANSTDPHVEEVLWGMVQQGGARLDECQQQKLYHLLLTFSDTFAFNSEHLGCTNKLQHTIKLEGTQPIRQPARRLPPHQREEVRKLIEDMLNRDIIQPSSSPWASPVVLVKKKDGSLRFCVDYRKLNSITQKDAYPLPRIDDTLDTLAGSQWFSTLDLISGYWQVEVSEQDRKKTAFTTHQGLYEFKVMPFGLCNAPATFQRLMDLLLAGVQWSKCLVYLDDIIVLGKTFDDHIHNLGIVLGKFREAGLRLKPTKCALLQESVSYLGHIVSRQGIATDSEKTERVSHWPTPTSVKEVQQFLGLATYYRRFVKDFAKIARPLYRLTEQGRQFRWTIECESAFATVKNRLTNTPILTFPDYSKEFTLDTDASQEGIGAVLSQEQDGQERVVAYASRTLSKAERKYCVTRKELLAAVTFISHFRPYLLGRPFRLRTDHGSLVWLQNFREPEGQLARWLEKLQEYEFTIVHRSGSHHGNADALSRRPCSQCHRLETANPSVGTPCVAVNGNTATVTSAKVESTAVEKGAQLPTSVTAVNIIDGATASDNLSDRIAIRRAQLDDEIIKPIIQAKESGKTPDENSLRGTPKQTYQLWQSWDQLELKDGVLYRRYEDHQGRKLHLQLVVPKQMQEHVLSESHAGTAGGHLGQDKTFHKVRERFFWPGYSQAVKEWCLTCESCAARKAPIPRRRGSLQNIKTGYPLQMVAVDIMGPFPKTKNGNSYILVASDYFTRWVEAYAIPNQEAVTVATKLVDNMFCTFSVPDQLHSDMGAQFEAKLIKEVCRILNIKKSHTIHSAMD